VSGGGDSVALGVLACRWQHARKEAAKEQSVAAGRLVVMHVDHQLRLGSSVEGDLVTQIFTTSYGAFALSTRVVGRGWARL
jgi:hypothetical protein